LVEEISTDKSLPYHHINAADDGFQRPSIALSQVAKREWLVARLWQRLMLSPKTFAKVVQI